MNRTIKDKLAGICLELELAMEADDEELRNVYIQRAKKALADVDYACWHEHHTSGVPYSVKETEDWK